MIPDDEGAASLGRHFIGEFGQHSGQRVNFLAPIMASLTAFGRRPEAAGSTRPLTGTLLARADSSLLHVPSESRAPSRMGCRARTSPNPGEPSLIANHSRHSRWHPVPCPIPTCAAIPVFGRPGFLLNRPPFVSPWLLQWWQGSGRPFFSLPALPATL